MANQIKELAQEIAFDYQRSLDIPYVRRIELAVIGYRATIIRQDYNKNGRFPSSIEESFCIELKQVSETDCCADGDPNCMIWKSKIKLPAPVRTKDGTNFSFVGNVNGTNSYGWILPEDWNDIKKGTRFEKKKKFYAFYNSYIYAFNNKNEKLRVRYVPENPEDLLELDSCDGNPCIADIRLPQDMRKIIKDWIRLELSGKPVPETKDIEIDASRES